jgi:hypothetical protein
MGLPFWYIITAGADLFLSVRPAALDSELQIDSTQIQDAKYMNFACNLNMHVIACNGM